MGKTVNGVVHEYIYDGDLLISEQFGDTLLIYVYDEAGSPIGFKYRTTGYAIGAFDSYVFEKNLQGDIIAIYNTSGTSVATYKYDAWGNVISATGTMASVNPFRYRGYYYDTETGFYYLQSRYYDPAIGRFINPDSTDVLVATPTALTDKNLYAYCDNNPIARTDEDGEFWHVVIGAAISGIFELGSQLISNGGDFSEVNWGKVIYQTAKGGITAACGIVGSAAISAVMTLAESAIEGETDPAKMLFDVGIDIASSMVGTGVGWAFEKIAGKYLINNLAKKAPAQIKKIVNKTIKVAGKDRNMVGNLAYALEKYPKLSKELVNKSVTQVFNSMSSNTFGYAMSRGVS